MRLFQPEDHQPWSGDDSAGEILLDFNSEESLCTDSSEILTLEAGEPTRDHLDNTLDLNRQLRASLQRKQEEISALKEKNTQLKELAKQTEHYAAIMDALIPQPVSHPASGHTPLTHCCSAELSEWHFTASEDSWLPSASINTPQACSHTRGVKRQLWPTDHGGYSRSNQDPFPGHSDQDPYTRRSDQDPYTRRSDQDPYSRRSDQDPYSGRLDQAPDSRKSDQDPFSGRPDHDPYSKRSDQDPFPGQSDQDPYSRRSDQDPYSRRPDQDPFSGRSDQDPYSRRSDQDPYSRRPDQDPFSGCSDQDPFSRRSDQDSFSGQSDQDPYSRRSDQDPYSKCFDQDPYSGQSDQDPFSGQSDQDPYSRRSDPDSRFMNSVNSFLEESAGTISPDPKRLKLDLERLQLDSEQFYSPSKQPEQVPLKPTERSPSDQTHHCSLNTEVIQVFGAFHGLKVLTARRSVASDRSDGGRDGAVCFKTSVREHSTVRTNVFPHGKTFTSHTPDGSCRFLWVPNQN